MFKELQPLLESRSLVLIITKASEDQISVSLIPKSSKDDKEQDKALLTPLQITATAEELDADIADAITDFTSSYKTVAEQVAATKAAMKATADAAEEKRKTDEAAKKIKGKSPATPAKKVEPAKAKPETKAEPKKDAPAPSLFDEPATETAVADEPEEVEADTTTEDDEEEVFEP